jgi:hypothetical protein
MLLLAPACVRPPPRARAAALRRCGAARRGAAQRSAVAPRASASARDTNDADEAACAWRGADAFTPLDDRHDAPPLALPPLRAPQRVVLVRVCVCVVPWLPLTPLVA